MASVKWFGGSSKEAIGQMIVRNCAVLIYIGKENDEFVEVFNDPNIVQLLNNEHMLCYKMDPDSPSFKNFKEIFSDVSIPSTYVLEKTNALQLVIQKKDVMKSLDVHLNLKCQILNAVYRIVKYISETSNVDSEQKYSGYINNIDTQLQIYNNSKCDVTQVPEHKKSDSIARIKIKIPSKEVFVVQNFPDTSSLNDVKIFVLNNFNLSERSLKCIAHRQFTDEDFSKTLDELELCPASTIYFHIIPSSLSFINHKPWFGTLCSVILKPFSVIYQYLMSFDRFSPPVEYPRPSNSRNHSTKEPTVKRKPVSNIHQLKHNNSDDENNTYNGNSTQQM